MNAPAGPADLFQAATAFWHSRVLAVAVELDLFSLLATGPASLEELCARLRLHPQPTEALLGGLCAIGILEHDEHGYRNGPTAATWLDRASPDYLGGLFALAGWQFPLWTRLRDLLETGQPQGDRAGLGFDGDALALRRFAETAEGLAADCGPALAAALDWSAVTSVVDLGGARGGTLATVLAAHSHLVGTCFDIPAMAPLFDELAGRLGLAERMLFRGGDFFADVLPPAEVYLLGHLMSDWDEERCTDLVARAAEALEPGGTLVVLDSLIDPDRPSTARNWLVNLNTQLVNPSGSVRSTVDCADWLRSAGMSGVQVRALVGSESLVLGTKPRR
ncbi:hypothetical protein BU204_12265 [Actinophytocola xanthii]|uniref:Methyltransferase n=1 Tax=Actinophytocola xanthii TaxID=1912961 RepID=A0A1Q8CSP8_9PSEU|nr:hypothetical protein BU204_12265 [Actinophytocola xanthii]